MANAFDLVIRNGTIFDGTGGAPLKADVAVAGCTVVAVGRAAARGRMVSEFECMFQLGDPPDCEPDSETSIAAPARRPGVSPEALAYDLLLERDGRALLYSTFADYAYRSPESSLAMMKHEDAVLGLGDGGAHCGTICDGSAPTFMLTHWARDRARGERLPLPWIVKALCRDTALTVGLHDRGLIAPG